MRWIDCRHIIFCAGLVACLMSASALAAERKITLASATSANDSGFLQHILAEFEEESGIHVEVIAVASREALEMSQDGDVDAVLSHLPSLERRIMDTQIGLRRHTVMSTHFLIAGPADDPARAREADSAVEAFRRVFDERERFLSRGDDSGTHAREMRLWAAAGVDDEAHSYSWYQVTYSGMMDTINGAGAIGAYTLVDYPNWLRFGRMGGMSSVYEAPDERDMHDVYNIIVVNPEQVSGVDAEAAGELADWLTSAAGQEAIRQFQIAGEQAYRPIGR